MAYIYKIINNINDKIYIGKTLDTIEHRWTRHLSDMNKRAYEKRPLYNAMRKYGSNHFRIEEIECCKEDIVNERECYWIEYYNSFKHGYNATKGGDGKAYTDVELIIKLWNEGKNNKEIQKITGYDHKTITTHLDNYGITARERQQRGIVSQTKAVAMLDKKTNEIIRVFSSASEAERFLQKSGGRRHIHEVCNGKRKTAYGYKWRNL